MPFIPLAMNDVKENEAVPEGTYDLRIVKVEDGKSKAGNTMTTVVIRIEDAAHPNASPIRHWLTYPDDNTPADQRQMRMLDIKRFLALFEVDLTPDGFDSDDLNGAVARCLVTQEEGDDGNIYNRLRLPKLKA